MVTFSPSAGDPLVLKSLVQQELLRRRILWQGFHNLSFAHSDADVEEALAAYREVLAVLKGAIELGDAARRLLGVPVEPVFRRTSSFDTRPAPVGSRA
jgi:hypothetical protein